MKYKRTKINEIEKKYTTGKIKKAKHWFFLKINKIDKLQVRLMGGWWREGVNIAGLRLLSLESWIAK